MAPVESWGRIRAEGAARPLWWRDDPLPEVEGTMLPFGRGRSYGDACLDQGGTLLLTRGLSRFISFDEATGLLACEGGVTLGEILARFAPLGFFPTVVPGTKHVTVGGAIANDIHGKNHHRAGTFGAHVTRLELLRSDGSRRVCSPAEHPELFAATVGGLGLTGLVTWAELRLKRIPSAFIRWETVPFENVDAFFELSARSDTTHEYTVAWIDCLARGDRLGRGLFYRGNHAEAPFRAGRRRRPVTVPFDLPDAVLNRLTVKAFNALYRWRNRGAGERLVHYEPFFFPLDGVERWNRIYGRSGLMQFQCVLPFDRGLGGVRGVLDAIARSGQGSFLAVLKTFGGLPSPGLLSFPRPGVTVALDFPRRGERTLALFRELEGLVLEQGGALYPAKDLVMSPRMFRAAYPRAPELERLRDPRFESTFWRRVTAAEERP
ncbi:FAD-binding oxidoreductase [Anaeromyxobacter diazotrophicus]|uniref:FAD-linked oxidase n=1 Tax=Anaeromyxobacter diazotrophicus TaxID=2590199 RepID=A0A7I9VGX0_9BACT|nr:FAD-binding oxidoreductase [Anaeromyxobacter diazotrophicus]GEJ55642.1 FAD-linked oxidase [Anaeromyxobacter diazotrophicus]